MYILPPDGDWTVWRVALSYSVHFVMDVFAEDLNERVIYVGINTIP